MKKKILTIICLSTLFALIFAACAAAPTETQTNPPLDDMGTTVPIESEVVQETTIPADTNTDDVTNPADVEVEDVAPETTVPVDETEPVSSSPPADSKPNEPSHQHSYVKETVAPTCGKQGYNVYRCACGDTYYDEYVEELSHRYATTTVAPTKDNEGYDLHTCELCGESYKDNYTAKVITYTEVNETVYAKSQVNIRTGPSTDYEKVGQLQEGESVTRIGVGDNNWSKVMYNDTELYIHSNYLSATKPISTQYPLTYSDSTCTITIEKKEYSKSWCYIAHLQFSDYNRFGSVVAKDNRGSYETTSAAAKRIGAIFCVNGPYNWGELANAYAVIRSGKVFLDKGIHEDVAIYNSATGKLANAGQLGLSAKMASDAVAEGLATDTFKFWNSTLVKNGANISNADNSSRAQRTFIATNGNPGDIYVIVAEGRYVDGHSAGLTKYECAKVVLDLGCNYGVMLDGGGSSTMYFNGRVLNSAKGNERAVVDFVYFK